MLFGIHDETSNFAGLSTKNYIFSAQAKISKICKIWGPKYEVGITNYVTADIYNFTRTTSSGAL